MSFDDWKQQNAAAVAKPEPESGFDAWHKENVGEPADEWPYVLKGGSFKNLMPYTERPGYQAWLDTIENPAEFEADMGATLFLSATLGSDPGVTWGARSEIAEALFRKPMKPSQVMSWARNNDASMDNYTWQWNRLQRSLREEKAPPWWEDVVINGVASGIANVKAGTSNFMANLQKQPGYGSWAPSLPKDAQDKLIQHYKENSQLYWEITKHPDLVMQRDDAVSTLFNMAAQTLPYIIATTGASLVTGPMGGFLVGHAVEGGNAYHTALDDGVPEERAQQIGAAVGLLAAAIEMSGGLGTEKLFELASDKIVSKGIQTAAKFGFGSVSEALEEATQELAAIGGESTYKDVPWDQAVRRVLVAAGGGAALGGGFHLGRTATRLAAMGSEKVEAWKAETRFQEARELIMQELGQDVETLDTDIERITAVAEGVEQAREEALAAEAPAPGEASKALSQATGPTVITPQPKGISAGEGLPVPGEAEAADVTEQTQPAAAVPAEAAAPGVEGTVTVYHGSKGDVEGQLQPDENGLVWATRDNKWAKGYGGNVLEFQLAESDILNMDDPAILDEYLAEHPEGRSKSGEMEFAESRGFKAVQRGNEIATRPGTLQAPTPGAEGKQPWEMTKEEYENKFPVERKGYSSIAEGERIDAMSDDAD
ncbi:MAG TPA: hypothetical protein VNA25_23050, partial [Phycisphaerae bacterium]|nr:hypothetical protein [Phycisphaerae bacterium]